MRRHYIHRIDGIRDDLLKLGNSVEQSLTRSIKALQSQNTTIALWVIENNAHIIEARRLLEGRVIAMLATQQPVVAGDLRLLAGIVAIATELERIGNYASTIARRVYEYPEQVSQMRWAGEQSSAARQEGTEAAQAPEAAWPADISRMTDCVQRMLHDSLESFVTQDVALARSLSEADNEVDALRKRLRTEFVALAYQSTQYLPMVINMLSVIDLLERAADRATNIGERVIYIITSDVEAIEV